MPAHNPAAQPCLTLTDLRVVRLGTSRVGLRLVRLLADQGATCLASTECTDLNSADVLIDDRVDVEDAERTSANWRTRAPRSIIIKFTDYPPDHPRWSSRCHLNDTLIHAELGLNRMTGAIEEGPTEPLALASTLGAMWGALYIAAALQTRDPQEQRQGFFFDLPLFSMTATVLGRKLQSMGNASLPDQMAEPRLDLMHIFACADGRYIQLHGSYPSFAESVCVAMGHEEWRAEAAAGLMGLPSRELQRQWHERLTAEFHKRPAAEWETAVLAAGGACTQCRTREEWLASDHVRATGLWRDAPAGAQPTGQDCMGQAVTIAAIASTDDTTPRHAPRAVQATTRDPASAPATPPSPLPLAGIRILDFCLVLAGPMAGRTLAEFGADVIKIDAPQRVLNNSFAWIDVSRGKRSMFVDASQPAGLAVLQRLVAQTDVLIENLRDGKLAALGLDFASVARLRPGIVYGSLNAFDYGGPWSAWPGWDQIAQAATGMQMARGRNGVPQQVPVPVNDYGTGLLGAYGLLLALRKARSEGCSVHVHGSLARTAMFIQAEHFGGSADRVAPPDTLVLRCADGWIRAQTSDARLAPNVAAQRCADAIAQLQTRGIHAALERTATALKDDPWLERSGLLHAWTHKDWGPLKQVVTRPAEADIVITPRWPAPDPGDDTATILAELGYPVEEVAALLAAGVVRGRMPLWQ